MQSIGKAARRSGVLIETIRYYERAGVLPLPERTASGRRLYDDAAIARVRFVKRCRDLGFPLAADDSGACEPVRRISEDRLGNVRAKIADLTQLESALADLVRQCDAGATDCPALRRLFAD